jgi:hypothetical protein
MALKLRLQTRCWGAKGGVDYYWGWEIAAGAKGEGLAYY